MSPEAIRRKKEITEAKMAAERVFDYMMEDLAQPQLQLFEDEVTGSTIRKDLASDLQEREPDKIILNSEEVERYRYIAAFLGAGFHMSQYDDITYQQNEDAGRVRIGIITMFDLSVAKIVPERSFRQNRMWDEVRQERFTMHVPSTDYDLGSAHYITSEEDLKQIFAFDYENLQACKDLDMDLLYEREI